MQELLTGKKRLPGFTVKPGLTLTEALSDFSGGLGFARPAIR
jgi:hypothetical protein